MKNILIFLIKIYQKFFSIDTGLLSSFHNKRACRFYPTCSQYTLESVERFGSCKGLILGFKRVIRCHPWNPGGVDEVPEKCENKK